LNCFANAVFFSIKDSFSKFYIHTTLLQLQWHKPQLIILDSNLFLVQLNLVLTRNTNISHTTAVSMLAHLIGFLAASMPLYVIQLLTVNRKSC